MHVDNVAEILLCVCVWGGGTEILGICLILWLLHMVTISTKSEVFQFSGGQNPLLGGLTIIKRS